MGKAQSVESRRDRRALAKDAGMGRISALSVLAGALCGLAALEIFAIAGGAALVGIHGSTNFGSWSAATVKVLTVVVLAVATAAAFLFGGYVGGRNSRRRGATHGLLAGIAGAVLAAVAVLLVTVTSADQGLAAVARHVGVADTWQQWRPMGLLAAAVVAAAMVVFALVGGAAGEHWHAKLAYRALDPAFGPEAELRRRDETRLALTDADLHRLAAKKPDATQQLVAQPDTPAGTSSADEESERQPDLVTR